MSINTTSSNDSLCDTARMICTVLDGASERAILVANDGTVLYMNTAARNFLHCSETKPLVTDFLVCENDNDWKSVQSCKVVMKNGKTTRSKRNIHLSKLPPCVCCSQEYYTAFICSKHERVREVVDIAFDAVLTVDTAGIIITANEAAMTLFDYPEGELVGQSMSKICGGGHAAHHDEYMKQYMETGIKKMVGQKRETVGKRRDGSEFPCEIGIQEVTDVSTGLHYYCSFIRDLTLIKQQEVEIEERQAKQQAMINASFDPMLEIDEGGIIQVVNDAACR